MKILGVRHGHDSSACLVIDGKIVADIAEERLTRKKNDGSFPILAIKECLEIGNINSEDLDVLAIPSRTITNDHAQFFPSIIDKTIEWISAENQESTNNQQSAKNKFKEFLLGKPKFLSGINEIASYLPRFPLSRKCRVIQMSHHYAHASSAYFTSGLASDEKALTVVLDGRGDNLSVSLWRSQSGRLELLESYGAEGSLGWFYAAATEALGWRHGSDEWKVMGLAPYGTPNRNLFQKMHPIYEAGKLKTPYHYGKPLRYPDHGTNHYHLPDATSFAKVLETTSIEDFAAETQRISEEQASNLILPWLSSENTKNLCCAGGFFMNVKLNGLLWQSGKVRKHWVYPNPGDSGLAAGAALAVYYENSKVKRYPKLESLYGGTSFSSTEIEAALRSRKLKYAKVTSIEQKVAELLAQNKIVGWFQGSMETGPRALGARSILMSPLDASNKDTINASVKYREKFRPFCPSIIEEAKDLYFQDAREEPFMMTAFEVTDAKRHIVPAVVHVDGTLRPQTVKKRVNPKYYAMISAFGDITGEPIVLNTSFNVKGEPIVCSPSDAIKCFFDTGLDYLAIGDFLVSKPGLEG